MSARFSLNMTEISNLLNVKSRFSHTSFSFRFSNRLFHLFISLVPAVPSDLLPVTLSTVALRRQLLSYIKPLCLRTSELCYDKGDRTSFYWPVNNISISSNFMLRLVKRGFFYKDTRCRAGQLKVQDGLDLFNWAFGRINTMTECFKLT